MKKQKRWQFVLIAVVTALTLYNIMPTILFYTKPLHSEIGEKQANVISKAAMDRINNLEGESLDWLRSYNTLLGIKASSIVFDTDNINLILDIFRLS